MIGRWRHPVQTAALALLVAIPLLNKYATITFVQGWYQSLGIGDLWIVSPLEGLESILVTRSVHGPLLLGMLGPVLAAVLLGRVFCSWVCPINTLQEFSGWLRRNFGRQAWKRDRWVLPRALLWYVLIAEVVTTLILGTPLWVFLSPPGLVGRELMTVIFFGTLAVEGVIILAVLGLDLITRHFYCRYLCPLGGLLGILGSKRQLRVAMDRDSCTACHRCDRTCPLGLLPSRGETHTATCWNCGRCIDACREGSLQFRWGHPSPSGGGGPGSLVQLEKG
jgi:ferredoxin-type protein NapH